MRRFFIPSAGSNPILGRDLRARRCIRGLVLGVALSLASACQYFSGGGESGDTKAEEEEKAAPVMTAKLSRRTMKSVIRSAATIEAERSVEVFAESNGALLGFRIEEGDRLRKGQVIARVEKEAQAASMARARRSLSKARRDLQRVKALAAKGIVGQQELDNARDRVSMATLDSKDRGRELKNTKIAAPFAGIVTHRFVQDQSFVSAGAKVLTLTDFATLVARVYIPERNLDQISIGQKARVEGKAAAQRSAQGEIKRIAPIVDERTGTVKVTVGLPPQSLDRAQDFRPGMYAEVLIETAAKENVLVVPKSAIIYEEHRAYVFVAKGDKAQRKSIELGLMDPMQAEVLSGLDEHDEIIVAGQRSIKDEAKIERVGADGQPLNRDSASALPPDSTPHAAAQKAPNEAS